MKKETKIQKSKKKESVYRFIELNQPSPEAINNLVKRMYDVITRSQTARGA